MGFSIGRSGFSLEAHAPQIGARVQLLINAGDKTITSAYYASLREQKDDIEMSVSFEGRLEWKDRQGKAESHIVLQKEDFDFYDKTKWGESHRWLHQSLENFHTAFYARIQNLKVGD